MDADSVLAEFRRKKASGAASAFGAGGRRVDSSATPRGTALTEIDDAMARMEARLGRLADTESPPLARARERPTEGLGELARLEKEARELRQQLGAEREAVDALRAALVEAEIEEQEPSDGSEGGEPAAEPPSAPAPAPAPPAAVRIRPSPLAAGGGTTPRELEQATARRAVALRKQVASAHAEVASLASLRARLEQQLTDAGKPLPSRGEAGDGRPPPAASMARRLYARLEGLEAAAREEAAPGEAAGGVHGLADRRAVVPLTVFSDGFMLYRGPFRPFGSSYCATFVEQCMAGYLPHELQQSHPKGFRLELHERCAETFAEAHAAASARASGGGAARAAGVGGLGSGEALLAPQRAEHLLSKLPESVLRDGNVVPVRAELAEILGVRDNRRQASGGVGREAGTAAQHDAAAVREARLRRFGGA